MRSTFVKFESILRLSTKYHLTTVPGPDSSIHSLPTDGSRPSRQNRNSDGTLPSRPKRGLEFLHPVNLFDPLYWVFPSPRPMPDTTTTPAPAPLPSSAPNQTMLFPRVVNGRDVPSSTSTSTSVWDVILKREKRQLIAAGVGLAVAVSGIAGFSISQALFGSDDGEIKQIIHDLRAEANDIHILDKDVHTNNMMISSLGQNLELFETAVQKEMMLLEQCQLCAAHAESVDRYITKIEEGIDLLLQHKFPINLINFTSVLNELPNINQALSSRGIRLLVSTPADLLNIRTSYAVEGDIVHIFLHLSQTTAPPLSVYRYIATPTIAYDKGVAHPSVITPNSTYLLLNNDHTLFAEWNSLKHCHFEGTVRYCSDSAIIRADITNSCLYGMFAGDDNIVRRRCAVRPFTRPFFVAQLTPHRFLFFATNSNTGRIVCSVPTQVKGQAPFNPKSTRRQSIILPKVNLLLRYPATAPCPFIVCQSIPVRTTLPPKFTPLKFRRNWNLNCTLPVTRR